MVVFVHGGWACEPHRRNVPVTQARLCMHALDGGDCACTHTRSQKNTRRRRHVQASLAPRVHALARTHECPRACMQVSTHPRAARARACRPGRAARPMPVAASQTPASGAQRKQQHNAEKDEENETDKNSNTCRTQQQVEQSTNEHTTPPPNDLSPVCSALEPRKRFKHLGRIFRAHRAETR